MIPSPLLRTKRAFAHGRLSFAYEGEDLILDRIFKHKNTGVYVDVGACDPMVTSNSFFFYRKGWKGLLVEPNPELARPLLENRPRDRLVPIGVSNSREVLTFFRFTKPEWNTFSVEAKARIDAHSPDQALSPLKIQTAPLRDILEEHLGRESVDFFSIDTEDLDLEVLKSNDFSRWRPRAVVVEVRATTFVQLEGDPVVRFLESQGYQIYAKTRSNTVFVDSTRPA